jgi:hypothetical protein
MNMDALITDTTDVKLGGIALYDGSQGLQVQNWYLNVVDVGLPTSYITVTDSSGNVFTLFSAIGISWARLAFDQNMHPVVTFLGSLGSGYYWWDPSIPGTAINYFPSLSNIGKVCCSMDDNRTIEVTHGYSDVIMAYVANNNLCFRQERDRYTIEYVLHADINLLLANAVVWKIGMNYKNRLQLQLIGSLYQ